VSASPEARPSITAEIVALIRAREQRYPPDRRVLDDPLAGPLLDASGSRVSGLAGAALARSFDLPFVGLAPFLLARHRTMDDLVLDSTRAGAAQVAILGAGYDSRAYRLAPPKGPARWFEVDLPALSRRKRAAVADVLGRVPTHVRYVELDFERERLIDRLLEEGLDPRERTLFIWEGVSYYLPEAAVHATLESVRVLAAVGSTVVLDVWVRPDLTRPLDPFRRVIPRLFLKAVGEPIRYWLRSSEAAAHLLETHGFEPTLDLDRVKLQGLFDRASGGRRGTVAPHLHVIAGQAR